MEQYLQEHMLTSEVIEKYGLIVGLDKIEIPIKDPQGNYLFSKYRVFNRPNQKYQYDKGSEMALFNADKITEKTNAIFIVEGEFDAICMQEFFDKWPFPCVAVSSTGGAGSWKQEWNEIISDKTVTILLDNDMAGYKGSIRLWELIPFSGISKINTKEKDICEMFYKQEQDTSSHVVLYNFSALRTLKNINHLLSLLDEDDLESGSNKEFNNLMRSKLGEMYQEMRIKNRRKVESTEDEVKYADISDLKEIPITNFIQFRHGVAKCIFHNETNPSMHYNDSTSRLPNTVKCYSCGKFADVIDVIQQLENVDFRGALEYLRKYNGTTN